MDDATNLGSLNEMIASLGGADTGAHSDRGYGLLMEHLQAARRDLLGAMGGEYGLSLEQARESAANISDTGARTKIQKTLGRLIELANSHR